MKIAWGCGINERCCSLVYVLFQQLVLIQRIPLRQTEKEAANPTIPTIRSGRKRSFTSGTQARGSESRGLRKNDKGSSVSFTFVSVFFPSCIVNVCESSSYVAT